MQTASLLGRILEGSVGEAAFFSGYGVRTWRDRSWEQGSWRVRPV